MVRVGTIRGEGDPSSAQSRTETGPRGPVPRESPSEAMESPSLEIMNSRLDKSLSGLVEVLLNEYCEGEGWARKSGVANPWLRSHMRRKVSANIIAW